MALSCPPLTGALVLTFLVLSSLQSVAQLDPQADSRLARKHTFSQPPATLSELLQAVSRQTGVALRVERTVAQHRAILVAHEQPLHVTLAQLADAFGFAWRRVEPQGKPFEYMLYQPAQALARQRAEWDALQQINQRIIGGALREIVRAEVSRLDAIRREYLGRRRELRETVEPPTSREEAIARLQRRFLIEASFSWHKWIAAYVLAKLPVSAWRRLESGEVLHFHTAQPDTPLPPNYVTVWKQLEQEMLERPGPFPMDDRWREIVTRNMQAVDGGRISLFMHPVSRALMYSFAMTQGELPLEEDSPKLLWYSPSEVAYLLEELLQSARSREEKPSALLQKLSQPLEEVKWNLQEMGDLAGNLLARFARQNGVNLVAEWYPYPPTMLYDALMLRQAGDGAASLPQWKQLEQFLKDYGYDMHDRGDFILITQRLRTLCRQYDVSETFVRRWLFKRGREGELDLNDVLELAPLLPQQIQTVATRAYNILMFRRSRNRPPGHLREIENHPQMQVALLAIASLPPALRQTVLQGVPVPFVQLPLQVQRLLTLATSFTQPTVPPLERAALLVRIEERNRPEPPYEIPEGDEALRAIVERFHNMPYEEFYASLSEEERRRYLRPRYLRDVQIRLMEGEEIYLLTGFYWERWGE